MAISKGDFEGANLVGGPFKDYVNDQVKVRQDILGKLDKDSSDIVWENGKSAFIALGSSVNIENAVTSKEVIVDSDISNMTGQSVKPSDNPFESQAVSTTSTETIYTTHTDGDDRIKALNLGGEPDTYLGNYLARNIVLFGGTSYYSEASSGSLGSVNMRSGLSDENNIFNDSAYGFGGNEQGFSAMPGVTSFNIKSRNMGSLREATVSIRANNEQQFKMIDNLYCRIGYTMFLEWGNTSYYNNKKEYEPGASSMSLMDTFLQGYYLGEKGEKISSSESPTNFIGLIENKRKSTSGNYDAFFGRVKNFSWEFNKDGYWEITLSLISWGDIIESLGIDVQYGNKSKEAEGGNLAQPNNTSALTTFLSIAAEPQGKTVKTKGQVISTGGTTIMGADSTTKNLDNFKTTLVAETSTNNQSLATAFGTTFTATNSSGNSSNTKITQTSGNTAPSIDYTRLSTDSTSIISGHAQFSTEQYFYIRFGDILDFIRDRLLLYSSKGSNEPIIDIDTDPSKNICYNPGVNMSADPSKVMVRVTTPYDVAGLKNLAKNKTKKEKQKEPDWPPTRVKYRHVFNLTKAKLDFFSSSKNPNNPKETFPLHGKIMNIYFEYQYLLDTIQNLRDENTTTIPLYDFINKLLETANSCLGGVNKLSIRLEEDRILRIYDQNQIPGTQNDEGNVINLYGILPSNANKTILNQGSFVTDFNIKTELTNEFSTTVAIGAQAQGKTIGEDATGLSTWNYGLVDRYYPEKIDSLRKGTSSKKLTTSQRIEKTRDQLKYLWLGYAEGSIGDINDIDFPDGYIPFGNSSFINAEDQYIFPNFPTKRYDQFVKLQKDWLKELLKLENEIANRERILNNERTFGTNQIGMIPINISVTMDGISGIRIYDRLKVDTRFLPNYYPQTLLWVIKGVSHEIQNNKWYTKLETIAVPKLSDTSSAIVRTTISRDTVSKAEKAAKSTTLEFDGNTPNADRLRTVLTSLGYTEKKIEKVNGELSSGGDLVSQTTNVAIKLFELIKEKYPALQIKVTGGNDLFHQNLTSNSYHKRGLGIDFVITPESRFYIFETSKILASVRLGTPGFRFLDEYTNPSSGATAGHFHFTFVPGRKAEDPKKSVFVKKKLTPIDLS